MLKAFVNPQKVSEASFDEEMALPFLSFRPEQCFFFLHFRLAVIIVANVIIWDPTALLVVKTQSGFADTLGAQVNVGTEEMGLLQQTGKHTLPLSLYTVMDLFSSSSFFYRSSQSALLSLQGLYVPQWGFKTVESGTLWRCHELPGVFVSKAETARGHGAIYNFSRVHDHSCRMATMKSYSCKAVLQGMWNMTTMHEWTLHTDRHGNCKDVSRRPFIFLFVFFAFTCLCLAFLEWVAGRGDGDVSAKSQPSFRSFSQFSDLLSLLNALALM